MVAATTRFTGDGVVEDCLCGLTGHQSCLNNHVEVTHYKRPHDAQNGTE